MKLAFVVHTVYPDFIGGREHHVHHLARAFAKDHDVVVIGGGKVHRAIETKIDGYRLLRLPMVSVTLSRNPLQIYRFIPQLDYFLKKENPDIIHAFEYGSQSTDAAYSYARKRRCPFFLTVYGYVLANPFLKFAKAVYDLLWGRFVLEGARRIYCVSATPYAEVLDVFKNMPSCQNKVEILPNGITYSDFKNIIEKEQAGLQRSVSTDVKLITVSRLLPRKNVSAVIRALHKVVYESGLRNVRLCVVGPDCGESENVKKLVLRLHLSDFVEFAGPVPYTQIKHFMEKSDIFVLPSCYEGVPLALLEAMACGKAVVCSDIPAGRHLISDGIDGLLFQLDRIDALADTLLLLIRNSDYRLRLGKQARLKAENFDVRFEKEAIEYHHLEAFLEKNCGI